MTLASQIMDECMLEERRANQKTYVGTTKCITIHPEWFCNLMRDPESLKCIILDNILGVYKLYGIPLLINPDVEKWVITV